jgi:cell division protein FtsN
VSEGERPTAALAAKDAPAAPAPSASAKPADKPAEKAAPAAAPAGGVGVQVGAFSSQTLAEAGWNKLVVAHESLKGMNHRILAGKADIGTVYRLQAVPGDAGAANTLCNKLQGEGVKCQVKH